MRKREFWFRTLMDSTRNTLYLSIKIKALQMLELAPPKFSHCYGISGNCLCDRQTAQPFLSVHDQTANIFP